MAATPILGPLGRSTYWMSSLTYLAQRDAKRATRGAPSKFEGGTSAQMAAKEWPLRTPFRQGQQTLRSLRTRAAAWIPRQWKHPQEAMEDLKLDIGNLAVPEGTSH